MTKYKRKTTPMQKRAIDNILSGKFKTVGGKTNLGKAMLAAGYTPSSARVPANLPKRTGVQLYLKRIEKRAKKKLGIPLRDKVMDTYLEGLRATKLYGKEAKEHPDYLARKAYADQFAEFFGWIDKHKSGSGAVPAFNQFNFFSVDEKKRQKFNDSFKSFLKRYYK